MKTLNTLQIQLLQAAESGDAAALTDRPPAKVQAAKTALAKAGLIGGFETDGEPVVLTEAGRAALAGLGAPCDRDPHDAAECAAPEVSGVPTGRGPAADPHAQAPASPTPKGKLGAVIALLRRPEGATIEEMKEATGWQAHSVRGAIAGAIKKKHKLAVTSEKSGNTSVYRIVAGEAA